MKTITLFSVLALGLFAAAGRAQPGKTNPSFEQLKALAGKWEGSNPEGKSVLTTYEVAANGAVLLERLHPTAESEMLTLYSSDGDRLALTHYCNAGNQPQMRTAALAGASKKFTFEFVRATNLLDPNQGHMGKLVLTLEDHDHFIEEWTWIEGDKPAHTEVLRFTRQR